MTTEEIRIVNRTSRNTGAVGAKAITPKYVEDTARPGEKILDFGAGKDAAHARHLHNLGMDVRAYEIGANFNPLFHDRHALSHRYDTVYASNVLNVAPTVQFLRRTLLEIRSVVKHPHGRAVFNYPGEPRKAGLSTADAEKIVREYFPSLRRVGGTSSTPLWEGRLSLEHSRAPKYGITLRRAKDGSKSQIGVATTR